METRTESRQERKERTRQAILDAALEMADEESLAALSLRRVARAAGIVPTAFYRHFSSVEELGLALVDESFASLRTLMRAARQDTAGTEGMIERSVATLLEHVHRHRTHFRFISSERFGGIPVVRDAIGHELDLFERELATDLARLPGLDQWTAEDLRILTTLIVNTMVATAEAILAVPAGRDRAEQEIVRTAEKQLRMVVLGAASWQPGS